MFVAFLVRIRNWGLLMQLELFLQPPAVFPSHSPFQVQSQKKIPKKIDKNLKKYKKIKKKYKKNKLKNTTFPVTHFHSLFGGRGVILRTPEH